MVESPGQKRQVETNNKQRRKPGKEEVGEEDTGEIRDFLKAPVRESVDRMHTRDGCMHAQER